MTGKEIFTRRSTGRSSSRLLFYKPFYSPSVQRRSRASTLSWTQFRPSVHSLRMSLAGPVTLPWSWKGQLKGSVNMEVGMGRVQHPGWLGTAVTNVSSFSVLTTPQLSDSDTLVGWKSQLSVATEGRIFSLYKETIGQTLFYHLLNLSADCSINIPPLLLTVAEACSDCPP